MCGHALSAHESTRAGGFPKLWPHGSKFWARAAPRTRATHSVVGVRGPSLHPRVLLPPVGGRGLRWPSSEAFSLLPELGT